MIKRYLQFIKENKSTGESIFRKWPLTDDKIEELFVDMIDGGFTIEPQNLFIDVIDELNFEINELAEYDKELIPCKVLTIIEPKRGNNDDLTDSFQSAIEYIESIEKERKNIQLDLFSNNKADHKYKVILKDDNGILDIDSLVIGNDISIDDDMELEGNLQVLIYDKDVKVKIGELELMEYYSWEADEIIDGKPYIYISQEDLANKILSSKDYYRDRLINGIDYEDYENSDYTPDTQTLFQYYLDKQNEVEIVKILIKEIGSLDDFREQYEDVDFETEDDLVEFLLKERFYTTLDQMIKYSDSDLVSDIKMSYNDLYVGAICTEHENNIEKEFDRIVDGDFTNIKSNNDKGVFYKIRFEMSWLQEDYMDYDFLSSTPLSDIFDEYISREYWDNSMSPYFSDYAHINNELFNKEVESLIKYYK